MFRRRLSSAASSSVSARASVRLTLISASEVALRVRLTAELCAKVLLDEAGRALGAAAYCRDPHFARMAADLPVFVRQSHAERDFAALGERVAAPLPCVRCGTEDGPWAL